MKFISEKFLYRGQWLTLVQKEFINERNEAVSWECIQRVKSVKSAVVVAKLKPSNRLILIKQYRPAIHGSILGFPAGLIDDDPMAEALRELKEETGYTGRGIEISPLVKSNSGVMDDHGYVIFAEVDETAPENQNPEQTLEPSEQISVHLVELDQVRSFLKREQEQGTYIGAGLWYLFGIAPLVYSSSFENER